MKLYYVAKEDLEAVLKQKEVKVCHTFIMTDDGREVAYDDICSETFPAGTISAGELCDITKKYCEMMIGYENAGDYGLYKLTEIGFWDEKNNMISLCAFFEPTEESEMRYIEYDEDGLKYMEDYYYYDMVRYEI